MTGRPVGDQGADQTREDTWLALLRGDVAAFNPRRGARGPGRPDLSAAESSGLDLADADLGSCELTGADLSGSVVSAVAISARRLEGPHRRAHGPRRRGAGRGLLLALWRDPAEPNERRSTDRGRC